MPIDGPLMAIDGPHGTVMAIDELRWDLSTGSGKTNTHRIYRNVFQSKLGRVFQKPAGNFFLTVIQDVTSGPGCASTEISLDITDNNQYTYLENEFLYDDSSYSVTGSFEFDIYEKVTSPPDQVH